MAEILIVEDDPAQLLLFTRMLGKYDFDLVTATSAEDAFDIINEQFPHLILMDVGLPGIDGIEAIRLLKSDVHLAHIPIIVITAGTTIHLRLQAEEAGTDGFHTKPLDIPHLVDEINRLLPVQ